MNYKFKNITIDLEDDLVGVMTYFKDTQRVKTYWFSMPEALDIDKLLKDTEKNINK